MVSLYAIQVNKTGKKKKKKRTNVQYEILDGYKAKVLFPYPYHIAKLTRRSTLQFVNTGWKLRDPARVNPPESELCPKTS